jgi:UrcA family protein
MLDLFNPTHRNRLLAGLAAAGLALAAAPSLAQDVDELTVTGRVGPSGEIEELSRAVSYADLDLTLASDRRILRDRVELTARELCDALGEPRAPVPPVSASCQRKAVNDAQSQMRQAFAMARPKTSLAYSEPLPPPAPRVSAPSAETYSAPTSARVPARVETVTNGPVPDTLENRRRYGGPMSNAGRNTTPAGN